VSANVGFDGGMLLELWCRLRRDDNKSDSALDAKRTEVVHGCVEGEASGDEGRTADEVGRG